MKKTGAIVLSMMMVMVLIATNFAGAYHTAARVYAAEEDTIGDGDNQEEETNAQQSSNVFGGTEDGDTLPPASDTTTTPSGGENTPSEQQLNSPVQDNVTSSSPEGDDVSVAPAPVTMFTVTFDANGHGTAPGAVSVADGECVAKPADLSAEGFLFTGWYRDAGATSAWDFDTDTVNGDITLYAGWTEVVTTTSQEDPVSAPQSGSAATEGSTAVSSEGEVATPDGDSSAIEVPTLNNATDSEDVSDAPPTMLRSTPSALNSPLQNGGLRAGQTVWLTLAYEGSGHVIASKHSGSQGDTVTIQAAPAEGFRFKYWELISGAGTIGDANCNQTSFTLGTTDATVKAVFESNPQGETSLAVYSLPEDGGTVRATVDSNNPAVYHLEATPADGYTFSKWDVHHGTGDISNVTSANTTITNISGSIVVVGCFINITYQITAYATPSNGGTTDSLSVGGPAINVGLKATPNEGYIFKEWKVTSGAGRITDPAEAFTVLTDINSAVTCEAVFEKLASGQYGVSIIKNDTKRGKATANVSYGAQGTEVTLTATPASGYVFKQWEVVSGGVTIDSPTSVTAKFCIDSQNVTIKALFESMSHDITALVEGKGTASRSNYRQSEGGLVTLTATPESGWSFDHWEVISGGVTIANVKERQTTFVMRDQDVVIKGVFVPDAGNPLTGISVTTPPDKITYTAGDVFEPAGMVVTAAYQNGSSAVTTGYTYSPTGKLTTANTTITITYTVNGVTKETTQAITVNPAPVQTYTVKFVDEDGTILQSGTWNEGTTPVYHDATPTKPAHEQYTYTFAGWIPAIAAVTGDATYTARYTQNVRKYRVTFVDEDGITVLKAATEYDYNTPAASIVKPADPTKAADAQYTYTFAGWTPTIAVVTGDATYTASYTKTAIPPNTYVVSVTNDGNGSGTANPTSGTQGMEVTLTATPKTGYQFKEWQVVSGGVTVANNKFKIGTANVVIKAVFEKTTATEELKTETSGLSSVPAGLQNTRFNTIEKIEDELLLWLGANRSTAGNNWASFDVKLKVSTDGGTTWVDADPSNFPKGGLTVYLPYPSGTAQKTHRFKVAHMFTTTVNGYQPGQVETPQATNTARGIRVTLKGLSPVMITWEKVDNSGGGGSSSSGEGSSSGGGTYTPAPVAQIKQNFDSKYYADTYPDLKAAFGYDHDALWNHYVTFGKNEKRKVRFVQGINWFQEGIFNYADRWQMDDVMMRREIPSSAYFDTDAYADLYPDLKAAFGYDHELLYQHYLQYGKKEGRKVYTRVMFNAKAYADRYPDLKKAFGYDRVALWRHYQMFGKVERRYVEWLEDEGQKD